MSRRTYSIGKASSDPSWPWNWKAHLEGGLDGE
uniref:Uncharacterized protein n=1 Tax=Human herpesvirus 2 TaxID=10310 RepID=A0A481TU83_HHV2|nr:hypothetical protein [Human alphaherpesvirus 2]QBH78406.1 hypothetical protein [Human alphaherpesvirus 2]QBH83681.1 hypothetical protein [Human alphaherpesvirus 2]QBH85168.1 hypothetical protein [Human alphaherpesvirus 2]